MLDLYKQTTKKRQQTYRLTEHDKEIKCDQMNVCYYANTRCGVEGDVIT